MIKKDGVPFFIGLVAVILSIVFFVALPQKTPMRPSPSKLSANNAISQYGDANNKKENLPLKRANMYDVSVIGGYCSTKVGWYMPMLKIRLKKIVSETRSDDMNSGIFFKAIFYDKKTNKSSSGETFFSGPYPLDIPSRMHYIESDIEYSNPDEIYAYGLPSLDTFVYYQLPDSLHWHMLLQTAINDNTVFNDECNVDDGSVLSADIPGGKSFTAKWIPLTPESEEQSAKANQGKNISTKSRRDALQ
ncbi:hypothetical protein HAQ03_13370 [Acidithiobacillus caldus]|uniref:hypothetical protein n=2 Tax=Acidithiobacillus caldus TaxID=33059 RepID=UPI001C077EAA|nr:hypothetical protein [Acidithiobacillus caldus]MBU2764388.1 hypothetical protein [Acidithiobacillus caldus]